MSGDGGSISASVCLVMEGPLVPLCVSGDGGSISGILPPSDTPRELQPND